MNTLKQTLFIGFFFSLSFCTTIEASISRPTLHAILITDTHAYNIAKSVQDDLRNIRAKIQEISLYTNYTLQEHIFEGRNTNPQHIIQYVRGTLFQENDIVLLYYSGHGSRTTYMGDNPWPLLNLTYYRPMNFSHLVHSIIRKDPQFILAIADNCNNYTNGHRPPYQLPIPNITHNDLSDSDYFSFTH